LGLDVQLEVHIYFLVHYKPIMGVLFYFYNTPIFILIMIKHLVYKAIINFKKKKLIYIWFIRFFFVYFPLIFLSLSAGYLLSLEKININYPLFFLTVITIIAISKAFFKNHFGLSVKPYLLLPVRRENLLKLLIMYESLDIYSISLLSFIISVAVCYELSAISAMNLILSGLYAVLFSTLLTLTIKLLLEKYRYFVIPLIFMGIIFLFYIYTESITYYQSILFVFVLLSPISIWLMASFIYKKIFYIDQFSI